MEQSNTKTSKKNKTIFKINFDILEIHVNKLSTT